MGDPISLCSRKRMLVLRAAGGQKPVRDRQTSSGRADPFYLPQAHLPDGPVRCFKSAFAGMRGCDGARH